MLEFNDTKVKSILECNPVAGCNYGPKGIKKDDAGAQ
jgi:hypothetical protein